MGRREIDGQAHEGEKAGRNSSQCRKRGRNSSRAGQKFTLGRNGPLRPTLGSARVSRVGRGVSPRQTLIVIATGPQYRKLLL